MLSKSRVPFSLFLAEYVLMLYKIISSHPPNKISPIYIEQSQPPGKRVLYLILSNGAESLM